MSQSQLVDVFNEEVGMGLDISAYSGLQKLDCVFNKDGDPIDAQTREYIDYDMHAYVNRDFPGRADDLEDGAYYTAKDSLGFRAGGYCGYNHWRDQLAELSGWAQGTYTQYGREYPSFSASAWKASSGPFWELINFSDCDGTIGATVSAKLHADFEAFQEKASQHADERFVEIYGNFKAAFALASEGGAVRFH
ncbi:hypothetical protein [Aquitalea aquatica]|uniref:Uncharacterized protein n=1 Tax=Aquitalea aquatica TaxID=3044273 RepID=A0A838Y502_9NEIS|nr:hypothetical protein [Aquitalea magnusonii]MBA4710520.1 hypothetical protein [Aquitalea magnusonii]